MFVHCVVYVFPEPQCSRFAQDRMGWDQSKVDEVLLPVLKRMHSREVMEGVIQVGGAAVGWGTICPHSMSEERSLLRGITVSIGTLGMSRSGVGGGGPQILWG